MLRRTTAALAFLLVCGLAVTGCNSTKTPKAASTLPSSHVASAAPPPAAPTVGSCHRLAFSKAAQPTDKAIAVPCTGRHTSVTIYVGQLDPIVDGHLLTVDSHRVQQQIATDCPARLPGYVGGDRTERRLSRFQVVWFSPTVAQSDAGANWYRCDLVALAGQDQLANLPHRTRHALDSASALNRFGTCGNTSPDKKSFVRVICADPHAWRAIDTVDLDPSVRYLARSATAAANAHCKDDASNRAGGALKFTWSFEWPTREQWRNGQHYGYCWVPSQA